MAGMTPEARQARIDRIIADKEAGIPRKATARALGISDKRLASWICEEMRDYEGFHPNRLTDEARALRRQVYVEGMAAGLDMNSMADRCGCTAPALESWLRDNLGFYLGRPKYAPQRGPDKAARLVRRIQRIALEPTADDAEARMKQRKVRECMANDCREPFLSDGPHHRMCGRCRIATATACSPYTPDPGGHTGRRAQAKRP